MKQIDWNRWSSIAEILSSIAVLVTLLFLAAQMRQTTQAIQATSNQGIADSETTLLAMGLEDPSIFQLAGKTGLSDDEMVKLHTFLSLRLRQHENYWSLFSLGAISQETLDRTEGPLMNTFAYPQVRRWWELVRDDYEPSFVNRIEALLMATSFPETPDGLVQRLREVFGEGN